MLFTRKRDAAVPRARVLARGEKTVLREFERVDLDRLSRSLVQFLGAGA